MAAATQLRDINSEGGPTAGADGDGLVVLVKLSEQNNEERSSEGPRRSLRTFKGRTVCSVYFHVGVVCSNQRC